MKYLVILSTLSAVVLAQQHERTTPVPILKQINRHNEDGSYSYGYEAADGSFKIETKFPTGEVQGKYGYVDDTGKLREIEYGASKRGFEPSGTDINVPPPTLTNSQNYVYPLGPNDEDDGQYREDPSVYYKDDKFNTQPAIRPAPIRQPAYTAPQQQSYNQGPRQYYQSNVGPTQAPIVQEPIYQNPRPQSRFRFLQQEPEPQQQIYQPTPRPQYYQQQQQSNNFLGHPATNLDLNTGSYSLSYTG